MAKQLSCGIELLRGILLFLNVLFVIVGITLIGLGVYMKVDDNFASILNKIGDMDKDFSGKRWAF
jgi:sulfite exporter TauE/SafE